MLRKNLPLNKSGTVTVGEVTFRIKRVGEKQVILMIDAPREMKIDFAGDVDTQDDVKSQASCR